MEPQQSLSRMQEAMGMKSTECDISIMVSDPICRSTSGRKTEEGKGSRFFDLEPPIQDNKTLSIQYRPWELAMYEAGGKS